MKRSEFLAQLKSALENNLNAEAVRENLDYYNEYIQKEMKSGKSEQEVLEMLGDPWAIARTITMSAEIHGAGNASETSDVQNKQKERRGHAKLHVFGLDQWWQKAGIVLVLVVMSAFVISVISGIVRLILPIALPILAIVLIAKIWKKK